MAAQKSYTVAINEYESLREIARNTTFDLMQDILINKHGTAIQKNNISLRGLDLQTQIELAKWELTPARKVGWRWETVRQTYRPHPKRFELSIWLNNSELCSASIGKPTRSGNKIRLDFLESAPQGTKLDGLVTDITISTITTYADAIGADQIRIMKPVNEIVKNYYLSKPGFKFDKKGNFCYADL